MVYQQSNLLNEMALKLLDSCVKTCLNISCRSPRNSLSKSRHLISLLNKVRYCSSDKKNDKPVVTGVTNIKELLDSSSPLRISGELYIKNDMWATSPYPEGTVFKEMESEETYEEGDIKDLTTRFVIMFPGQGNQFVGMAKNLLKYSAAVDMFQSANEILNYDLLEICLKGPEEVLNNTEYCQPATFVCSLALLEKLKDEKPWVIRNCWATCGYSLGEFTALVFAGCVNFETGLKLVKLRAKAMASCCKKTPGGMLTILTGQGTTLGKAFSEAIEYCKSKGIENPQCAVASYLFPNCKVIAGNLEALDFIQKNAKSYGIRRHSKLPVSGAFHTLLMKDAGETFKERLNSIKLNKPLIKVFSNLTAKPYINENQIHRILPKQIYSPIKWEQTIQNVLIPNRSMSLPIMYECGPGQSLTCTLKKINAKAGSNCCSVQL